VGFSGTFPPNDVTHYPNPKRTVLGLNHVIWATKHISRAVRAEHWNQKKGQYRTGQDHKRSQKGYLSPIWGEAPTGASYIKNCLVGDVLNIITCAKFQNKIFRGYDFTGGRAFHFPIEFWMGLTIVQCYCAACDDAELLLECFRSRHFHGTFIKTHYVAIKTTTTRITLLR